MQALRRASFLARLVLAWFALSLGVAMASPLVQPAEFEVVCTGKGAMKLVAKGEGAQTPGSHALECQLCSGSAAPPPIHAHVAFAAPLAHAVQPIPAARIASILAAPLPARGPPASPAA
ncbi:hypothetical protein [Ramlibacter sp. PS4R-6]|uniref:hypothetical protein n=1 Tax=Ramlibacter sp. PS4R-6 TaxID=3133438 RepID=UPI0030A26366